MTITPAMQQFYDLKEQNPDSILFFRMWDFYEMFDEDAHIAHKVLGIHITTRNKNSDNPIPLAGIPFHAKDKYLPQLVKAGYKVAIAEQVSDPKLKWIVKREIVRVVTPATLSLEWDTYNNDFSNYIVSISENNWKYGISTLDSNSATWTAGELDDFTKLSGELYKISPTEVVLDKSLFSDNDIKDIFSKKYSLNIYFFDSKLDPLQNLLTHFGVKSMDGFWLQNKPLAQKAASHLLDYLSQNQKTDLSHLSSIKYNSFSWFLDLDESTIRNLDLIYNLSTNSRVNWTLLWVLDKTKTPMWKRFLAREIVNPLNDLDQIKNRQDFIEEFLSNPMLLDKVQDRLKWVSDLDNILTRLALWRALPRDLLNLKRSLSSIVEVFDLIEELGSSKLNKIVKG